MLSLAGFPEGRVLAGEAYSPLRALKVPQHVCQVVHQAEGGQGALVMYCSLASQVALVVENLPANVGDKKDMGLIPGSGRSPGEGHGNPLQYSCLESPWGVTVHRVAKSQTRLKRLGMRACS